jgi:hypothetical protein
MIFGNAADPLHDSSLKCRIEPITVILGVCDPECLLACSGSGGLREADVERVADEIGIGCFDSGFSKYFGIAG